jgi:hypothetical protein
MGSPDDYNAGEWEAGRLKPSHVSELTKRFQQDHELPADGKCGPTTRAVLDLLRGKDRNPVPPTIKTPDIKISADGWMSGSGVAVMPIHASWYYAKLSTVDGNPKAIVAHYTATKHGTAINMARNRGHKLVKGVDREASWHVSIEGDGSILQMAPLLAGCWHAGGKTSKPIPGVGKANYTSVGIELVGYGDFFPEPQVLAACRVWYAIRSRYGIPADLCMITHQELDPTRKADPGKVWMTQHAPRVLTYTGA